MVGSNFSLGMKAEKKRREDNGIQSTALFILEMMCFHVDSIMDSSTTQEHKSVHISYMHTKKNDFLKRQLGTNVMNQHKCMY